MEAEVVFWFVIRWATIAVLLAALVYGIIRFLVKRAPMYFRILTCAVGCYSLTFLFEAIYFLCFGTEYLGLLLTSLGYFGCTTLLLSASGGQFDTIADDKSPALRKYRWLAVIAPAAAAVVTVLFGVRVFRDAGLAPLIFTMLAVLPGVQGSYYQLKHLILPCRDNDFLRSVRPCNVLLLLFDFVNLMQGLLFYYDGSIGDCVFEFAGALCLLLLMIFADRGCRKWTI